jgi:hypothetical protein
MGREGLVPKLANLTPMLWHEMDDSSWSINFIAIAIPSADVLLDTNAQTLMHVCGDIAAVHAPR